MVFPAGYLVGAFVLKKISALSIYSAASTYGWPRVYKRILEQSRIHIQSPQDQKTIQYCVRSAIEQPTEMYIYLKDSKVVDLAQKYIQSNTEYGDNIKMNSNKNSPPTFLYSWAKIFVQALTPLKFLSALGKEAEKKLAKRKSK